jgi:hypothetical protein
VREGSEFCGCGEPASEVCFEGALIDVAFTEFAELVHYAGLIEENHRGVEQSGDSFLPQSAPVCLKTMSLE